MSTPFVLVILSRKKRGDAGEFFGTRRIVAHKVARKMARARKQAVAVVLDVCGGRMRVLDGRTVMGIYPATAHRDALEAVS